MRISTKGRYALRVMLDLAQHSGEEYISLSDIAYRQDISIKYLEMIVGLLVKAGLVVSLRGKNGGYRLKRPTADYTAGQILRAAEGRLSPVACLECSENDCSRADRCLTLPLWKELDRRINRYLDSVTLDALAEGRVDGENYPRN